MSALKDGGYTVTLKGKEYRLLFTLNALDEIQGKFGGYDKLNEVFNQNNPDWVKDTKWPVSYTHLDVYKRQLYGYSEVYKTSGDNLSGGKHRFYCAY